MRIIRSQTRAVEIGDLADQLLGALPGDGATGRSWRRAGSGSDRPLCASASSVAESSGSDDPAAICSFPGDGLGGGVQHLQASCPSPRYMCTPHGRHGSKLRTVRMMSMPLKFSRSFSSKIG